MSTVFDIEQKQNSPEKILAVAGIPERFYVDDWELNATNRKAIESAIENVKLDFSWSNKPEHRKFDYKNISHVQLLVMNFRAQWMLDSTDEVWLLIDRYKPKKAVRTGLKFKGSGFKHSVYPDLQNPDRPAEILVTNKVMVLDFGQPLYFQEIVDTNSHIRAKGVGSKNFNGVDRAWQILEIRIKVKKGDKIYYSNLKAKIKMVCHRYYNNGINQNINISYQLL